MRIFEFNGIIELFTKLFLEGLELVTQMQGISVSFKKEIEIYRQQRPTFKSTPLNFIAAT